MTFLWRRAAGQCVGVASFHSGGGGGGFRNGGYPFLGRSRGRRNVHNIWVYMAYGVPHIFGITHI